MHKIKQKKNDNYMCIHVNILSIHIIITTLLSMTSIDSSVGSQAYQKIPCGYAHYDGNKLTIITFNVADNGPADVFL